MDSRWNAPLGCLLNASGWEVTRPWKRFLHQEGICITGVSPAEFTYWRHSLPIVLSSLCTSNNSPGDPSSQIGPTIAPENGFDPPPSPTLFLILINMFFHISPSFQPDSGQPNCEFFKSILPLSSLLETGGISVVRNKPTTKRHFTSSIMLIPDNTCISSCVKSIQQLQRVSARGW